MIRSVKLSNWRSFEAAEVTLGARTILVGENNAGKSNLLLALRFLFGDTFPSGQGVSIEDVFERDPARTLSIEIDATDDELGDSEIRVQWSAQTGWSTEQMFSASLARRSGLTARLRDNFPLLYLSATRSAGTDLTGTPFRILGRAQRRFHESVMSEAERQRREDAIGALAVAQSALTTDLVERFERIASATFADVVVGAGHSAELDFRLYDPGNLYRAFRPIIVDGGFEQDVARSGDGLANLATIAIFKAYAETNRGLGLLVIEEPESWLHPHALRSLDRVLREIELTGAQVLLSTHTPELLRPDRFDEIVVVSRDFLTKASRVSQVSEEALIARRRETTGGGASATLAGIRERYAHLFDLDQAEGFLARAVVLVEGDTEKEIFSAIAAAEKIDLDRLGVSLVSAEGKTKLDQYYDLYDSFDIPVFLVFDTDAKSSSPQENQRWNNLLIRRAEPGAEDPNPGSRLAENWATVSPNIDVVLQAEVEAIETGLWARLVAEVTSELGTDSKVIVARYVMRALSARGDLTRLASLPAIVKHIAVWADQFTRATRARPD